MKQLAADCALMEELRVMDYSLLLGVHYRSQGYASSPQVTDKVHPYLMRQIMHAATRHAEPYVVAACTTSANAPWVARGMSAAF